MKYACLTFDDGYREHYDLVRPMLKSFGFTATFFVTSSFLPRRARDRKPILIQGYQSSTLAEFMTWDEVLALHQDGFEIGSHLSRHVDMRRFANDRLKRYAQGLDDKLERIGIGRATTLAYPSFYLDDRVKSFVKAHGYRLARSGCEKTLGHYAYQYGGIGSIVSLPITEPFDVNCSVVFGKALQFSDYEKCMMSVKDMQCAVLCFHGFNSEGLSVDIEVDYFRRVLESLRDWNFKTIRFDELTVA